MSTIKRFDTPLNTNFDFLDHCLTSINLYQYDMSISYLKAG